MTCTAANDRRITDLVLKKRRSDRPATSARSEILHLSFQLIKFPFRSRLYDRATNAQLNDLV